MFFSFKEYNDIVDINTYVKMVFIKNKVDRPLNIRKQISISYKNIFKSLLSAVVYYYKSIIIVFFNKKLVEK